MPPTGMIAIECDTGGVELPHGLSMMRSACSTSQTLVSIGSIIRTGPNADARRIARTCG
jgi:hypothetical protein